MPIESKSTSMSKFRIDMEIDASNFSVKVPHHSGPVDHSWKSPWHIKGQIHGIRHSDVVLGKDGLNLHPAESSFGVDYLFCNHVIGLFNGILIKAVLEGSNKFPFQGF